ncbi:MAG: hypothetical protein HY858_02725 [Candidatus Solibacter usitatus]|nr:hypothetical protein [Candidatus Solibacter usitatus]
MRRVAALALLAGLTVGGCKRARHTNPGATIEEQTELASAIGVAERQDSSQLLSGFHEVEQGAWRWTMKEFAVSLAPPPESALKGVRLELEFSLPQAVAGKLMGMSITPAVSGVRLKPFKVEKAGDQKASFEVSYEQLRGEAVIVQFFLDKWIAPGDGDSRELGLVVSRIGFFPR